ncbi:AsmA-like C-terminal region-containing protein [Cytophagaceae bacterium DM2B3-1]|uniref:AsmA-like C-terminal region-containing protein n=1 Tax=Xanthocytophaga flava TaxID=3048013 RepID=A0ABT7CLT5_9BACT|nr:AsmA-like C-terminal region-containing protein [Xanthocytophaga flavus]MDJ1494702.1 AsmA-like C-terminal region-containing protein [Xanthocytophaga flavus]
MKKVVLIFLGVIVLLLGAAFILPIIYKDEIKAKLEQEIAKKVNAKVYFDAEGFSVSLFKHFPNITASLEDFGVVGKDVFRSDTLLAVPKFQVTVDIMSVISGDKIKVKAVDLESPRILAKVLKDGKANWDIYIADTTQTEEVDTSQSNVAVGIDSWSVTNGHIIYDDRSIPVYTKVVNLNHTGSGDFEKEVFDMNSQTSIDSLTINFDGVEYLSKKKVDADITLSMDLKNSKYTFKENNVKLNDFALGFDGWFAMPDTNYTMDITFKSKDNTFKSLLSMVPGVYTESFKDLEAKGDIAFDGYVKGTFNGVQMPGFGLNTKISNGSMKYSALPTTVNNINVDMKVDDASGNLEDILVDIQKFHLDLGKNPVDGRFKLKGLSKYDIDTQIKAQLNLAELIQMFPIDGMTLKGLYAIDVKAKGVYDTLAKRMPAVTAAMSLTNGYVKTSQFPAPLEQMNVNATINNNTGQMRDTKINVSNFRMILEGEPLEAKAYVENLDDYTWDIKVKGGADLTKMTKIYPIEGMTLTGRVYADIETKGKMSDVDAQRYDKLPTSGSAQLTNFTYSTKDMPTVKITKAEMSFTPQEINLTTFNGFLGKSDVAATGSISNYINYVLHENAVVKGNMSFSSTKFDVNEWMVDDPNKPATEDTPLTVVEIPKNIDFRLVSSLKEVLYDNMNLKDMVGTIIVKDGTVRMENLAFNTLGGSFIATGGYDSRDIKKPAYDFNLKINNLAIAEAYQTFNTVKTMMPMAQYIGGSVNVPEFSIKGLLKQDMMPDMATVTGGGILKLVQATLKESPVTQGFAAVTKLSNITPAELKDVILSAKIENGRVSYQPFDVKLKDYTANVSGSNGLDGSLDYKVKVDVPTGKVGAQVTSFLSSQLKTPVTNPEKIQLDLGVGGTFNKPQIKILGSSATGQLKSALTDKANAEVDKAKAQAQAELEKKKAELEQKAKAEAEAKLKAEQDKINAEIAKQKKELEEKAAAAKKKAEEEAKNKLKSLFNKGTSTKDTTKR